MKNHESEKEEFRKYTQFVNAELVRVKAKDFDGEAAFASFVTKERAFQTYLIESALWIPSSEYFFNHFNDGSLLFAKGLFRERVSINKALFEAIRNKDREALASFKFNFMFFDFIRKFNGGKFKVRAEKMFLEIEKIRAELSVNTLPIAVARGKMFYEKTPRSHLSLMDCVTIANQGIMKGLDKYDGTNGYRGAKTTAIIVMRGYLIKEYSATWIALYPVEQKVLYKCRSVMGKKGLNIKDIKEITKLVNESFAAEKNEINRKVQYEESYLLELLISTNNAPDTGMDSGDGRGYIEAFQSVGDDTKDISKNYEDNETMKKVVKSLEELNCQDRKVIKLKGMNV